MYGKQSLKCLKCGSDMDVSSKYCAKCGHPIFSKKQVLILYFLLFILCVSEIAVIVIYDKPADYGMFFVITVLEFIKWFMFVSVGDKTNRKKLHVWCLIFCIISSVYGVFYIAFSNIIAACGSPLICMDASCI